MRMHARTRRLRRHKISIEPVALAGMQVCTSPVARLLGRRNRLAAPARQPPPPPRRPQRRPDGLGAPVVKSAPLGNLPARTCRAPCRSALVPWRVSWALATIPRPAHANSPDPLRANSAVQKGFGAPVGKVRRSETCPPGPAAPHAGPHWSRGASPGRGRPPCRPPWSHHGRPSVSGKRLPQKDSIKRLHSNVTQNHPSNRRKHLASLCL